MTSNIKKKLIIAMLAIAICLCTLSMTTLARAGGGGSGGGGGGGGGSSTHSHGSSHSNGRSNPIGGLINIAAFVIISGSGTIIFVYRARKAKRKSVQLMEEYQKLGINWDYHEIQDRVETAYFEIQEAWRLYDPFYAAEYLSEELADKWRVKLEWMKIRNEEIVQHNVQLISAVPIGVHDETGEEKDQIWYLIHGKMVGYYRDFDTKRLIRGNPRPEDFFEYWLFIRRDGRWVLHEIRQKDEMDIDEVSVV